MLECMHTPTPHAMKVGGRWRVSRAREERLTRVYDQARRGSPQDARRMLMARCSATSAARRPSRCSANRRLPSPDPDSGASHRSASEPCSVVAFCPWRRLLAQSRPDSSTSSHFHGLQVGAPKFAPYAPLSLVDGKRAARAEFVGDIVGPSRVADLPGVIHSSMISHSLRTLDFTDVLHDAKVKISMDGRGRWIDNRMIERLWRSLKYECVYLNACGTGSEARNGIGTWISCYNERRPHSSHGLMTPGEAYDTPPKTLKAAA